MNNKEKYLKQKYHDALKKAAEIRRPEYGVNVFTPEMIQSLAEMAKNNIYPDGRFGDVECNIWSLFNRAKTWDKTS